ncbi:unnamed protein product [Mytilus coruscus]|uniref:Endonuclease/exonuclease/phosphatase domain-containing protein n=1 Tax=Mytilus coruscus TaxID=42192 RepID=A0A6J8AVC5_MYTCO|nr:unnamed protein product [Mytilus coruscus]
MKNLIKTPPKTTKAPSSSQVKNVAIPQQYRAKPSVQLDSGTNFKEHNTPSLSRNGHLPQYTGSVNSTRPEISHMIGQPVYYQPHPNNRQPLKNPKLDMTSKINTSVKKQNIQPQLAQTMTNSHESQDYSNNPIHQSPTTTATNSFFEMSRKPFRPDLRNCTKVWRTHEIIIGGDFNEDLYNLSNNSRRKQKLDELMVECKLKTNSKGLTFINVNGIDTSEIDYFLYTDPKCEPSKRLIDLSSNVSDHHPISMRIKCNITREQQSRNSGKQKHKVRWNKVDKSRYEETINSDSGDYIEMLNSDRINIEFITLQAMDLLSDTAKQLDQKKTYGKNKLKLNV